MAVTFSPAAARDVEEIGDYIHSENPAAARRFVAALRARCDRIANAPRGARLDTRCHQTYDLSRFSTM
ncbi:type II toxin-antitoxin system RelE/ParE family toxin [Mesorhizobium sp. VK2B]|uniref:Type II toxin-antitoxin system RelE/ParE family toxin n=1 Tax=Mesorhizobium humile TaxID=3072313 RepID=A0ABU4YFH3_9HYPH|nr:MULTISPECIES: type II toxin-antitoxin system RelE/ParE family toxin [unclassified Mesorhizobium]MDX8459250.1 type II toxin-antitoxin system RelE/ParE family toxin [Mesorhizobium sp. VK2D]MDX8485033.1 type II toxin-antitoxin system RelE/ParE family toxin [Mesorhizobium sp. VK2B]